MNHDLKVTGTKTMNSTPEKVWDVLTNPELIKEYLFGTQTVTDWQVGSSIVFQGEYNGQKYSDHGIILSFIPARELQYSYWSAFYGVEDKPENYAIVTCLVDIIDNTQTQLQWIMQGYTSEAGYQHSLQGMDAFMNQIKGIAER
jgi:uncharacterized protein YndB with AHSA1/START domain